MTLKLALYARDALIKRGRERQLDIKVFLTRDRDVNVGIADRAELAAQKKAQLFLSIHFNGGLGCNRVETFYRVKEKNQNYQDDKKLSYKIQRAVFDLIHGYLPKTKQDSADHGIKPDTQTEVKSLGVLRDEYLGPGCRSCLVEIAAIDIQEVDQLFNHSPEGDQVFLKVAEALAQAMVDDLLEQG
jgi:N-acetylmuramoyl-L-alanine amidase